MTVNTPTYATHLKLWACKSRRRIVIIGTMIAVAPALALVLLGITGMAISNADLSPMARLLTTPEKREAIDRLRGEGARVSYLRMRYRRRDGWRVDFSDDLSVDDATLERSARDLRILQPSVLYLRRTNVGDSGIANLKCISGVRFLDLGWTNVTDAALEPIASLPLLRELYLNHTRISDAGLPELARLEELTLLCTGHSLVTEQGIDTFMQLTLAPHVYVDTSRQNSRYP